MGINRLRSSFPSTAPGRQIPASQAKKAGEDIYLRQLDSENDRLAAMGRGASINRHQTQTDQAVTRTEPPSPWLEKHRPHHEEVQLHHIKHQLDHEEIQPYHEEHQLGLVKSQLGPEEHPLSWCCGGSSVQTSDVLERIAP